MMHQIRKMILVYILIINRILNNSSILNNSNILDNSNILNNILNDNVINIFNNLFNINNHYTIYKAPGEFLYLYRILFPDYNRRTQYDKIDIDDINSTVCNNNVCNNTVCNICNTVCNDYEHIIINNILNTDNINKWYDVFNIIKKYKHEYKWIE
ncbi:tRNA pseudouridine synthase A [Ecytonucleospora hepatopenaei]|uniref:tRNA pseudouridine synthase A n=1 Tax=Ecytonucleospora hepatopenaei TaxID=646526 RepID=A0A1W0E2X3_9MICR|nr:tRNA pseudouridine synthase A [Ecytonucleospora hepatopenaei]